MKYADLHIHSTFSDSSFSCEDICKRAYAEKLACISIADHDSLDAYLNDGLEALSEKYSLEVLRGIEFSTEHEEKEVHLLGYFADNRISEDFLALLDKLKADRLTRIVEMIEKLSELGIALDRDEFKAFAGGGSISRLHLGVFLQSKNIVCDINQAFKKYVGVGKPAYVSKFRYKLAEGIKILKTAGALVFLAHPRNLFGFDQIKELAALGLNGIEAFYPSYSPSLIEKYIDLGRKSNLLIAGGSDSHGKYKRQTIGVIKMPYEHVEKIKAALR
ncbi:PHP domain-containing protein [Candidatus Omnitrophota bacterium]